MTGFEITLAVMAYIIVGMIVAETARVWAGMWWLSVSFSTILLWPLIAISAIFGKHHD